MCILGVLYRQSRDISANTILRSLPRTQSPERLKAFLNELAEKGKIEIIARDDIRATLKTYIITQSGRDTVIRYVDASYEDVMEVYRPKKPTVIEDLKAFWKDIIGIYPTHKTE
jgi:DNA-binding PadR family transcriptional regulator